MSKGSLFFGKASGKLGQIVLSNVKGQQIARAWQPKVANPRTSVQQMQRAKFANAVKFYKRATQNLFKFAFEDKRKTESDYNAFMRHNVELSEIFNRKSYDNMNFPALSEWVISVGSLGNFSSSAYDSRTVSDAASLSSPIHNPDLEYKFPQGITESTVTVGHISDYFKHDFGALDGDFVTFVGINTNIKEISDEPSSGPWWSITQIKIDSTNSDLFLQTVNNQAVNNLGIDITDRLGAIIWKSPKANAVLFGVVLSRVTANGVLVSTSNLGANEIGVNVLVASLQDAYRQQALNSWLRSSDPILKGSVVKQSNV